MTTKGMVQMWVTNVGISMGQEQGLEQQKQIFWDTFEALQAMLLYTVVNRADRKLHGVKTISL